MKSFIIFLVACNAGKFCCAIDLDFQLTEIWGESKNDSNREVDPLPALPPYTFGSRFEKKNNKQTKKAALQNMFLVHEYNHKIPFQCFIEINSNTDPNFTTTFNFVTSSLLLMGNVSFPIRLGFQSQVKN